MGQVFTLEEFQKLNPKNLVRWEDLVNNDFQQNSEWDTVDVQNPLNGLAAQSRLFYPRSFSVSPSLNSLNTPWFIDYGHLMFWFFFLSTFVIVMWLVTLHSLASKNIETRLPKRETRGFSRAQTGDVMTAVLPLTWSITMLMHASTHSINFDENTAATVFSFTVVAYQWGWNYYFPRDVVDKLARGPRLVGRGGIDLNQNNSNYSLLLERARLDYMTRLAARGQLSDKNGKEVMSNLLNLFSRAGTPGQTMALQSEVQLLTSAWTLATWGTEAKLNNLWFSSLKDQSIVDKNPSSLSLPNSAASWALANNGSAQFSSLNTVKPQTNFLIKNADILNSGVPSTKVKLQKFFTQPYKNTSTYTTAAQYKLQPNRYVNNTSRSLASIALVGNRLGLIHKHLSSSAHLPHQLTAKTRIAHQIHLLLRNDAMFAPMHKLAPSFTANINKFPVSKANIVPNLWLANNAQSLYNPVTLTKTLYPHTNSNINLNSVSSNNLNYKVSSGYNSINEKQQTLFSGAPYSLSFKSNNFANFDDLGLTNSAVSKEFLRKITSQVSAATSVQLQQNLSSKKKQQNFGLQISVDSSARVFNSFLVGTNYNFLNNPTSLPLNLTYANTATLLATQTFLQGVKENKLITAATVLPKQLATLRPTNLLTWVDNVPTSALNQKNIESKLLERLSFFTKNKFTSTFAEGSALKQTAFFWNPTSNQSITTSTTKKRISTNSAVSAPQNITKAWLSVTTSLNQTNKLKASQLLTSGQFKSSQLQITQTHNSLNSLIKLPLDLFSVPKTKLIKGNSVQLAVKPFWSNTTQLLSKHALPGFVLSNKVSSKPALSSFLEGATSQRPVRSTSDRSADPLNFAGKADFTTNQPFFTNHTLYTWGWLWTNSTLNFAFPSYKFQRGAFVKKPLTGFWTEPSPQYLNGVFKLENQLKAKADKEANFIEIPTINLSFSRINHKALSYPLLDSEWSHFAKTPAILTPEPAEDIDQNFIHNKWTVEINSTRRSDHTSKFKVTWGPWATFKKNSYQGGIISQDSNALAGLVGAAGSQNISTQTSLDTALFNENILPFKTSTGLTHLTPLAVSGDYTINFDGANLIQPLIPQTNKTYSALTNTFNFIHNPSTLNRKSHMYQNSSPAWSALWNFKQNISDSSWTGQKLNIAYSPSYWTDKALLTLTNKKTQSSRLKNLGIDLQFKDTALGLGKNHPLLNDLQTIANYVTTENYSTSTTNWLNRNTEFNLNFILSKLSNHLEQAIDQHLISRANYSMALDEVGSIRRLRVTKGVYLPSDTAMHVICGSKDVIHSWALPGLNIKIDCIPGFNSHRRLLLRWRGAYWGQCMEVCGRYHHWMPILIHVVHKDIFLAWCLTYLKLLDARAQELSRSLALIANVDLVTLDTTLASMLTHYNITDELSKFSTYIVSSDLDD